MSSITIHYDPPPRMSVRCIHCHEVSLYPIDRRCPAYSYRDEAEYWKKRCRELEIKLIELTVAMKGPA